MQSINRAARRRSRKGVSKAPTVGNPGGICSKPDSELVAGLLECEANAKENQDLSGTPTQFHLLVYFAPQPSEMRDTALGSRCYQFVASDQVKERSGGQGRH